MRCLTVVVGSLLSLTALGLQSARFSADLRTYRQQTGSTCHNDNVSRRGRALTAQPVADEDVAIEDATTEGVFGAAALVAGNMVGGGILAIPTVCAGPGFYPAAAMTICLWAANVGTGLLLGEVAAAAVRRGDEDVSLRALSRDALGESGAQLTSAFFVVTNCVEINQCVGCTRQFFTSHFSAMTRPSWLGRAVRNRHRHSIEQASRRWRGGRRDDS